MKTDVLYRLAASQLLNLFSASAQVKIQMTDACTGEITDTFDKTGFVEAAGKLEYLSESQILPTLLGAWRFARSEPFVD